MQVVIEFLLGMFSAMFAAFLEYYFGFKRWFSMMIAILLGLIVLVILYSLGVLVYDI